MMWKKTIQEFGAVGDGKTLNTAAIQAAIDACAEAGGGLVVIENGAFVTGTLFLHSFVELHLEANGILLASTNGADYPNFQPRTWNAEQAPRHSSRCLIYAEGAHHVSITGTGTINCCGEAFCEYTPEDRFWRRKTTELPARMIHFYNCTDVLLSDFSMLEMAGGWAFWINGCSYVRCTRLRVRCNQHYPNSDGIHINCSSDVSVSDCSVICGDDCLIVRANTNTHKEKRACERVSVTGCHFSSLSNAIRVGWTNDYKIQNCVFSDCTVTDSWRGISIEFPKKGPEPFADQGEDFSEVRNLIFSNITMDRIDEMPLQILVYPYNQVKTIHNIRFDGILADCGMYPVFLGMEGADVSDITLTDCRFTLHGDTKSEAAGCTVERVRRLTMNHTVFDREV